MGKGSTPYLQIAAPRKCKYPKIDEYWLEQLEEIIDDLVIDVLVLGVPHLLDGKKTSMTKQVEDFGEKLEKHFQIPVYRQDETLSSFEAKDRMKNSPRYNFKVDESMLDALSATVILEDFLNSEANHDSK